MNPKAETETSRLDTLKLIGVVLILLAAVVGFYYFADQIMALRVAGLLFAVGLAGALAMTTEMGANTWDFVKDARMELRKVVWPTRAETLQTSLAVIVMVVVMGIFLWLLDILLLWVVRLLTGQ